MCLMLARKIYFLNESNNDFKKNVKHNEQVTFDDSVNFNMKELLRRFIKEERPIDHDQKDPAVNNRFIPDLFPMNKEKVISQHFSEVHNGVDLPAKTGEIVYSSAAGHILATEKDEYYGNLIIVDHFNGYKTYYAHLSDFSVETGNFIEKNGSIGFCGSTGYSTGPHLHYSISYDGEFIDPESIWKK